MSFDISKFIFIDQHAHSIDKKFCELDELGFRQCFSETRSLAILQDHLPKSLHYTDLLDHLERIFAIKDEKAFLEFRSKQNMGEYLQMLWDDVSIAALIIDDGFSQKSKLNLYELSKISERPIFHCLRLESIFEELFLVSDTFEELCSSVENKISSKSSIAKVALKTICAYRGGLSLLYPERQEAKKDFERQKIENKNVNSFRIQKSPFYHYLLLFVMEIAPKYGLAIQIHTGIGDDDALLLESNPAILQPLIQNKRFQKTNFVFLHCFPYVKEAAFLCSLYRNVYMDLSLSISLASPIADKLIAEALAVAPASKILAGSDGHTCPEAHWFGALCWKRGLTHCLYTMINNGILTQKEAEETASMILHANALNLYKLEGLI